MEPMLMENHIKLHIYKGMIKYILSSTRYTLKTIALMSNSSLHQIRSIYCDSHYPNNFHSEVDLVQLYQIILETNLNGTKKSLCVEYQWKKNRFVEGAIL